MRGSNLVETVQADWEAGAQKDIAPNLIDDRGFLEGINALLDYNGLVFKRGGSRKLTTSPYGSSTRFIWDGLLGPGHRTFFAGPSGFAVISADGVSRVDLGGTGLSAPSRAVALNDYLFVGNGPVYGGSRKAAPYVGGTIAVTHNARAVVGSGTSFLSRIDAGMLIRVGTDRVYTVASVADDTHLTLADDYQGTTASGLAYVASATAALNVGPYYASDIYAVVANRLIVAVDPNVVRFSKVNDPHTFGATDYHRLPEGVKIVGMAPVGQDLLIFTTKGIWLLRGLALELIDAIGNPQQQLVQVSDSLVLWGNAGIAPYSGGVIVPTVDGVYVVDASGVQSDLGRSGVRRQIAQFATLGYKPGLGAVYRDHYFLPILDVVNNWITTLVCRLDLPVRVSRRIWNWPWTELADSGAKVAAFALRAPTQDGDPPLLLGAAMDGYITDLSSFLEPDAASAKDHDGTTPGFYLTTRDYPTAAGATGRARRVRILYEMIAGAFADPRIGMDVATVGLSAPSTSWDEVKWDEFQWQADDSSAGGFTALKPTYGPDAAINKGNFNLATRAPYVRFRIRSTDPVAKLSIRTLELFTVPPGSARQSRSTD